MIMFLVFAVLSICTGYWAFVIAYDGVIKHMCRLDQAVNCVNPIVGTVEVLLIIAVTLSLIKLYTKVVPAR
jgi:hypothetical protein